MKNKNTFSIDDLIKQRKLDKEKFEKELKEIEDQGKKDHEKRIKQRDQIKQQGLAEEKAIRFLRGSKDNTLLD